MNHWKGPRVRAELGRKAIHLATAALPAAWGLGYLDRSVVLALLTTAAVTAVLVEWARRRRPEVRQRFDVMFDAMLRERERLSDRGADGAQLTGATWLALTMLACVIALPQAAALTALWAGATGDALAALVGIAWSGSTRMPGRKTLAGSVACLGVTALGAWWLGQASPLEAVAVGAAAALAERPVLALDDNVRVAAVAGLTAWVLGGA